MTQVIVDAQNLWFILQQYKNHLNNKCPMHMTVAEHQEKGSYFPEYSIIKQMEQQIREVI